jgi:hypothetical protein
MLSLERSAATLSNPLHVAGALVIKIGLHHILLVAVEQARLDGATAAVVTSARAQRMEPGVM